MCSETRGCFLTGESLDDGKVKVRRQSSPIRQGLKPHPGLVVGKELFLFGEGVVVVEVLAGVGFGEGSTRGTTLVP